MKNIYKDINIQNLEIPSDDESSLVSNTICWGSSQV